MTIGEELKSNFPKSLNKSNEIFRALIANEKQTGVMESILNDSQKFTKEYYGTPNIYDQEDTLFDKTVEFFTFIERFTDETDDALKKRIAAIFYRSGDTVWGTPYDVKNVFRQYFPSASIFLVENVNAPADNLCPNGDFQDDMKWVYSDDSVRSTKARFSRTYGIELKADSYANQTVTVPNSDITYEVVDGDTYESIAKLQYGNEELSNYIKDYKDNPDELSAGISISIPSRNVFFLHFFLNGNCKLILKNNKGEYWNNKTDSWQVKKYECIFESVEWEDKSVYIFCTNDINKIEIDFEGIDEGYVDFIRLFLKYKHPSFSIIAQFEGGSDDDALALADGSNDPEIIDPKMSNWGYYDGTYLTGVSSGYAQDLYEDLIEYVKAKGVKAYIEIVNRDYIEEE